MESLAPLCTECASLKLSRKDFEKPPFVPEEKYHKVILTGTVTQLKRTRPICGFCRLILHVLERNEQRSPSVLRDDTEWELQWMQNNFEYDPVGEGTEDRYGSGLYPKLKSPGIHSTTDYCIQLIDDADTNAFLRGRKIGAHVDLNLIKQWICKCREEHGPKCKKSSLSIGERPKSLRCIDVAQNCLSIIDSKTPYVALSYVWGSRNEPQTRSANILRFSTPGAFAGVELPKTIANAMEVTKALAYRYCWVDSLCITQDYAMEKSSLIGIMDAIYGNADLTIVAASGDSAQSGLSGWDRASTDVRQHRSLQVTTIGTELHLGVLPMFDRELLNSTHATRGWT